MQNDHDSSGDWDGVRFSMFLVSWGIAFIQFFLFTEIFGFSMLDFGSYSRASNAAPALIISVMVFFMIFGIAVFFVDTSPQNIDAAGEIILRAPGPLLGVVFVPAIMGIAFVGGLLAIPLDNYFTPKIELAYWVWAFWTTAITTTFFVGGGFVMGRRSLFALLGKLKRTSPGLFIAVVTIAVFILAYAKLIGRM